ncbi:MAG: type II toxin-antitoxin system VapC family toxin, partial [Chitinispirillia bacterium]
MDKVFLDTNIIFDLIKTDREHHNDALRLMSLLEEIGGTAYMACISVLNVMYSCGRENTVLRDMKTLVERIYIIETDENIIKNALNNPGNDFEDSVQYYCAKKCDLDVIITHDADFHKRDIP